MMSRYAPVARTAPRILRKRIPRGEEGTRRTAHHMVGLIHEGARDFYVRQHAIDVLLSRRVPAKDYMGEVRALFEWVQHQIRYTKDPFRIEVLHTARRMLELRAGDCDDMTVLLGAMLKSIGHPVRIVLTGPDGARPGLFSHVYLEAQVRGRWIPLDPTMPHAAGWAPRTPVRRVVEVDRPGPGVAGLEGASDHRALGDLVAVIYRSDRWSPGRSQSFIHRFVDPPGLWHNAARDQLLITGGSYRVTPRGIEG